MGIYLTRAEVNLHEWRVTLRKAQATLQAARGKNGRGNVQEAEDAVKWALRRVAAAQDVVDLERARRTRIVDSLLSAY